MRIVLKRKVHDSKIFTDDGINITKQLNVQEIKIVANIKEGMTVFLKCQVDEVHCEFDVNSLVIKKF